MLSLLRGATNSKTGPKQNNLVTTISMLRLKVLTKECSKNWNDYAAQGLKNQAALADMHEQLLQTPPVSELKVCCWPSKQSF